MVVPALALCALKETPMRSLCTATLALVLGAAVPVAQAEPLVTKGIGLSKCGKLANDMNPSEGLDNVSNVLVFYWIQGYLSAANIYLLNEYTNYINLDTATDAKMIKLVYDFCKANPDKTPIYAVDKFIRDTKKIDVKESEVFDPWEQ
jgi:hypothetical protein